MGPKCMIMMAKELAKKWSRECPQHGAFRRCLDSPKHSMGPQSALPMYGVLSEVGYQVRWPGEVDSEQIHFSIGGRQGTTEMASFLGVRRWLCLGPLVETWRSHGKGVAIPATVVGAEVEGHPCNRFVHGAGCTGHLVHLTWVDDDFVPASKKRRNFRAWELR